MTSLNYERAGQPEHTESDGIQARIAELGEAVQNFDEWNAREALPVEGVAVKLSMVGGGGGGPFTVTVTSAVTVPPGPVAVSV